VKEERWVKEGRVERKEKERREKDPVK